MYESEQTMCEVPKPANTMSIAKFADRTSCNLKEATMILDQIAADLFGLPGKKKDDVPPAQCFRDVLGMNAETSTILVERLAKLRDQMFG